MDAILKTQAEQLSRDMASQATTLDDLNGLMRSIMKSALERMLNTEMEVHLGRRGQLDAAESVVRVADATTTGDPAERNPAERGRG
jgi:hypothetical protein